MDEPGSTIQHVLVLRRVDPDNNVARFYALMIEHDLFGRVVLVRRWGRIGTRGGSAPADRYPKRPAASRQPVSRARLEMSHVPNCKGENKTGDAACDHDEKHRVRDLSEQDRESGQAKQYQS